jgi:hypothetical protein
MKKPILFIAIISVLLSCNSKSQTAIKESKDTSAAAIQADYLQRAKESQEFKNAWIELQKVKINVGLAENKSVDTDRVVDEFNNSIGAVMGRVDNIAEVKEKLKKDTAYLKIIQLKIAANIALSDAADANSKIK